MLVFSTKSFLIGMNSFNLPDGIDIPTYPINPSFAGFSVKILILLLFSKWQCVSPFSLIFFVCLPSFFPAPRGTLGKALFVLAQGRPLGVQTTRCSSRVTRGVGHLSAFVHVHYIMVLIYLNCKLGVLGQVF